GRRSCPRWARSALRRLRRVARTGRQNLRLKTGCPVVPCHAVSWRRGGIASHNTTVIHSTVQTGNELKCCKVLQSCPSQTGRVFRCSLVFGLRSQAFCLRLCAKQRVANHIRKYCKE